MKREIKFRGISKWEIDDPEFAHLKEGQFVIGQLVFEGETPFIVGPVAETDPEYISLDWWCPVRPETVGQLTGLKDHFGEDLYEGDIVDQYGAHREIVQIGGSFCTVDERGEQTLDSSSWVLVGNRHSDSELLAPTQTVAAGADAN